MNTILSPSKTQNFEDEASAKKSSKPVFHEEANELASILAKKSPDELKELMDISDKLAELNYERFQKFTKTYDSKNAKQALFAYEGDVYNGIEEEEYSKNELDFAQDHLRIITGMYGVLRPLDLIQAYRLEMKTKLLNPRGGDLYKFWGDKISSQLNKEFKDMNTKVLVNLASNEYSKSINKKKLKADILDIQFKDEKNGKLKTIAIYAKMARGEMANFIVKNQIDHPEDLKAFNASDYVFNQQLSDGQKFVFTR